MSSVKFTLLLVGMALWCGMWAAVTKAPHLSFIQEGAYIVPSLVIGMAIEKLRVLRGGEK